MHHIARCCQPIPGDEIVGFITQGRGISVHRADCEQLAELRSHAPERIVEAVWGESYSAGYSLVVRVQANDRSGLLRDITTILANEKVNVLGVASRSDIKQQIATIDMTIEIYNLQVLGRVLGKLNQVPDVIDARRLHGGKVKRYYLQSSLIYLPVILYVACVLAWPGSPGLALKGRRKWRSHRPCQFVLAPPVTDQRKPRGLMGDILVPHRRQPSAVQIRIRRICHCVAACLQLELFRVYEYKSMQS